MECDESMGEAPEMISAQFSGTGGYLEIGFDKDTDEGLVVGEVGCDEVVEFPGAAEASCSWQDARTLIAVLDSSATVLPGDEVSLVAASRRRVSRWLRMLYVGFVSRFAGRAPSLHCLGRGTRTRPPPTWHSVAR